MGVGLCFHVLNLAPWDGKNGRRASVYQKVRGSMDASLSCIEKDKTSGTFSNRTDMLRYNHRFLKI